jgi:dipeptidyl aminopeptidase/acylaminoacyl peptidase
MNSLPKFFSKVGSQGTVRLLRSGLAVLAFVLVFKFIKENREKQAGRDSAVARQAFHEETPEKQYGRDLAVARQAFHTHLLWNQPSPQQLDGTLKAPPECDAVLYPSGTLNLQAWVSKDPNDGKRHPAVVYLHGNWVFEPRHWDCTLPYRNAGFIVLTPMLRGENGNPGNVEMFWGEVDDVVAAGKYVASLSYVDPSKVFLAGHSVGGTLTMLTAMVPSPYVAAAAFSGSPDQREMASEMPDWKVFDTSDAEEFRLRSPKFFPESIRCPLHLFAGDQEGWCIPECRRLAAAAQERGKDCTFLTVPGDHLTSKPIAIEKSLEFFRAIAFPSKGS